MFVKFYLLSASNLLNRITILQKRALTIINCVDFRAHSNPLFNHRTLAWNIYASIYLQ